MAIAAQIAPRDSVLKAASSVFMAGCVLAGALVHAQEPSAAQPTIPPSPSIEAIAPSPIPPAATWYDRPIKSLKASVKPTEGELPTNVAAPRMAEAGVQYQTFGPSRPWLMTSYEWEAAATRHLPLWFEEPNLERLGYTYGFYHNICGYETGPHAAECLQPIVSGMHFFGRIPFIPYMWGYQDPCEPVYTLGVDRPGSPVPYRKHLIPLSLTGAVYQGLAITGLPFLIP